MPDGSATPLAPRGTPPVQVPGSRPPVSPRRTLLVASASTLVVLVAFVNPLATGGRTAAALDAASSTVPWLMSAMALGLAVALLPTGSFADDVGRRRVFVAGLVTLAVGSLVCATATGSGAFVAGRLVAGVGGAAVLACGLGLIGHAFPPGPERAHATGVWGASVGGGIAVGGLLVSVTDPGAGWRGGYVAVAVAALVLAAVSRAALAESTADRPRRPDLLGAALLGGGLAALLAAVVQARSAGLTTGTIALLAAAGALLSGFVAAEARLAAPMLDLALFRRRPFVAATVGALANGLGATALAGLTPTVIQGGLGESLLDASLVTLVFAGTSVVAALAVRRLPPLTGRTLLVGALLGIAAGQVLQTGLTPDSSVARLVPGAVVVGIAFGVLNAALGREAVAHVPADRTAMGSGANNTARYVGSALGLSLVTVVVIAGQPQAGPAGIVAGWNTAAVLTAALSVAGATVIASLRPPDRVAARRAARPFARPDQHSPAQLLLGYERVAVEAALTDQRLAERGRAWRQVTGRARRRDAVAALPAPRPPRD